MSTSAGTGLCDEERWEHALHLARTVPLPHPPDWPGAGLRGAAVVGSLSLAGCALVAAALTHVLPDHACGWGDPGRQAGLRRSAVQLGVSVVGLLIAGVGAALFVADGRSMWFRPWPPSVLTSAQQRALRQQVRERTALDLRLLPLALHVAQSSRLPDGMMIFTAGMVLGQAGLMAEHTGWFALVPAAGSTVMGVVVILGFVWGRGARRFLAEHAPPARAVAAGGHDLRALGGGGRRRGQP